MVDLEANVAVANAKSNAIFDAFKQRVAEEYAAKTVKTLQASVRFTEDEVKAQPPITGEVDTEMLKALTSQAPTTFEAEGTIFIPDDDEEDESRKRARTDV